MSTTVDWNSLRGPISFALGSVILLTELMRYVFGHVVDPQLLVVGAALCGVQAFLPMRNGHTRE